MIVYTHGRTHEWSASMAFRRDLVLWLVIFVLAACGEYEGQQMPSHTSSGTTRTVVRTIPLPDASLTQFAFHSEHILRLELRRNDTLFAPGYREVRYGANGVEEVLADSSAEVVSSAAGQSEFRG